jgi:hypothetical protein
LLAITKCGPGSTRGSTSAVATAWPKRGGSRVETLEKKSAEKKSAVAKYGLNNGNKEGWQRLQKQSQ